MDSRIDEHMYKTELISIFVNVYKSSWMYLKYVYV